MASPSATATRAKLNWNISQQLFLEKLPQNGASKCGDKHLSRYKKPRSFERIPWSPRTSSQQFVSHKKILQKATQE